jgi:sugar lactone lactonase YvrE
MRDATTVRRSGVREATSDEHRRNPAVTGPAVACTTTQALLGEGARWDARRGELLAAVDIVAGVVVPVRSPTTVISAWCAATACPGTVGSVAPIDGDDGWILAAGRGFTHLSADGDVGNSPRSRPLGRG